MSTNLYEIETNFGKYHVPFMPTLDDILKYYVKAKLAGIDIPSIKFQVRDITPKMPPLSSISKILADAKR